MSLYLKVHSRFTQPAYAGRISKPFGEISTKFGEISMGPAGSIGITLITLITLRKGVGVIVFTNKFKFEKKNHSRI
jgi:hypothetical protein